MNIEHRYRLILPIILYWVNCIYCQSAFYTTNNGSTLIPHCSKTFTLAGQIARQNLDILSAFQHQITFSTDFKIDVGFKETICFKVQPLPRTEPGNTTDQSQSTIFGNDSTLNEFLKGNDSFLCTISYTNLIQIHPIRQQYVFGLPYLKSKCICDCPGGERICQIGFNYKNCSKFNSVCITTFHPHQSTAGCTFGSESELCCQINISPFKNRKFNAIYLGQPEAMAQLSYHLFRVPTGSREWMLLEDHVVKVPLNKEHRMEFVGGILTVLINALKPHYQLKEGMYFYDIQQLRESAQTLERINLMSGTPLNELYEWSVQKLGWFRFQDDGQWEIRNGWIKLQDAHHVEVQNCKEQIYNENYNAEYFTMNESRDDIIYLGNPVEKEEKWITKIYVERNLSSRQIIVLHADSPSITVQLTASSKIDLTFYHHASRLLDFSGRIEIDKYSNRFLNISYRGARGTLLGYIYRTSSKYNPDMAFSSYLGEENSTAVTSLLSLPLSVNTSRYVCIHPVEKIHEEKCRWFPIEYHALDWFEVPYTWTTNKGECSGCNEVGVNDFLSYLNPIKWFRGISSAAEALAIAVEVTFYIAVFLAVITFIRRCLIPLIKFSVCTPIPCSTGKSNEK